MLRLFVILALFVFCLDSKPADPTVSNSPAAIEEAVQKALAR
jgi:hypothetical protein